MRKLLIVLLALGLMCSCVQAKDKAPVKKKEKVEMNKSEKVSMEINKILQKHGMALDAKMVLDKDGATPVITVVPLEKKAKKESDKK